MKTFIQIILASIFIGYCIPFFAHASTYTRTPGPYNVTGTISSVPVYTYSVSGSADTVNNTWGGNGGVYQSGSCAVDGTYWGFMRLVETNGAGGSVKRYWYSRRLLMTSTSTMSWDGATDFHATTTDWTGNDVSDFGSINSSGTYGAMIFYCMPDPNSTSWSPSYGYQAMEWGGAETTYRYDIVPITPGSISLIYPVNNATTTPDFFNWFVNYSTGSTTTGIATSTPGQVAIYYGMSSTALNIIDRRYVFATSTLDTGIAGIGIGHQSSLLTATTTWYAQARLYDYTSTTATFGTLLASSSIVTFTIPSSTLRAYSQNGNLSTVDCNTMTGIEYVTCWLFAPSQYSRSVLSDEFQNYEQVVPFSIFFSVANQAINSANGTNSTSTTWHIDLMNMNQQMYTFVTITSSSIKNAMVTSVCDLTCVNDRWDRLLYWERFMIYLVAALDIAWLISHPSKA